VDRFLLVSSAGMDVLQLVGITCLLIATKFEEVYTSCLSLDELVSLTVGTFTQQQILITERLVLIGLEYNLTDVTIGDILGHLIEITGMTQINLRNFANYLTELVQCHCAIFVYKPSVIATSIVFITWATFGANISPLNALLEYSKIEKQDLQNCITAITQIHANDQPVHMAARKKYLTESQRQIATIHLSEF